jgi:cytochrome c
MKFRYFVAVVLSMSVLSAAFASEEGELIFRDNGCDACHAVARKSAGPSIREIVAKYAGDKHAQIWLEKKVRMGGSGSFGTTSMPPIIEPVTDKEIRVVVGWILGHKLDAQRAYD